jgi:hypothetical protein
VENSCRNIFHKQEGIHIRQDLLNEIDNLQPDLQFNGYLNSSLTQFFIHRVLVIWKEKKFLGSVFIPYVTDISKKFKHTEIITTLGQS